MGQRSSKRKRTKPCIKEIPREALDFRRDVEFRCAPCEGMLRRYRGVRLALPEELRDLRDWRQRRRAVKYLQERARGGSDAKETVPDATKGKRLRSGTAERTDFSDEETEVEECEEDNNDADCSTIGHNIILGPGQLFIHPEDVAEEDELYDDFDEGFDDDDEEDVDEDGNEGDEEDEEEEVEEEEDEEECDAEEETDEEEDTSEDEANSSTPSGSPAAVPCLQRLRSSNVIRPTVPLHVVRFQDEEGFEVEDSRPPLRSEFQSRYNSYLEPNHHHHRHHHRHHGNHQHPHQVQTRAVVESASTTANSTAAPLGFNESPLPTGMGADTRADLMFAKKSSRRREGNVPYLKRNSDDETES